MNEKTTNVVTSMSASARSSCSSCSCPTNNSMETAQEISVETLISGHLCYPGVKQWFKFTVPESKSYTIFTTGSLDTEGALYDCNCNRIDDETTNIRINGKLDLRIKCELLVGMTYYLCVSEAKGNTGTYTLKVTKDTLAEATRIQSNRDDGIILLEQGKTYQLPSKYDTGFLDIANIEHAPLSVHVEPTGTAEERVFWYASSPFEGAVDIKFDWQDSQSYQTITPTECGSAKLCACDWLERGRHDEIDVVIVPSIRVL